MTEEAKTAYIAGFVYTKGTLHKKGYTIELITDERQHANFLSRLLVHITNKKPSIRQIGDQFVMKISDRRLWTKLIEEYGLPLENKSAKTPKIKNPEAVKAFIGGFSDAQLNIYTDPSTGEPGITISSPNERILQWISQKLQEFDVNLSSILTDNVLKDKKEKKEKPDYIY